MPPNVTAERFAGCLIGQCLGDALGFPIEGTPPETCIPYAERMRNAGPEKFLATTLLVTLARFNTSVQKAVQEGTRPERLSFPLGQYTDDAQLRRELPFGQYTDDSQLARELMQSYAALGRFDPEDYAARICAIFREHRIVGRGRATNMAAERLAQGIPWKESGVPPPDAGNGTAMRAGPVGLLFGDNSEEMIRVAGEQSWITHQDPRCWAGAVAIAGAVALAARPQELRVTDFLGQLSEWVRTVHPAFAEDILRLAEWVQLPPGEAAPVIARCGAPDFYDDWKWISPFVVPSVLWSLYAFQRSPEDYWETICTAIEAGGDVDTTAAMAGAICGAHVGLRRLNPRMAHLVNDQGTWGYDQLVDLARRCYDRKWSQEP